MAVSCRPPPPMPEAPPSPPPAAIHGWDPTRKPSPDSYADGGDDLWPALVTTPHSRPLPSDDGGLWTSLSKGFELCDRSASPAMPALYLHPATDDSGSDPWPEAQPSAPADPSPALWSSSAEYRPSASADHFFRTKLIKFNGRTTPIVLQGVNGPCPLIAICNVLLLRGAISLGEVAPFYVTSTDLVQLLAERIVDVNVAEGKYECDLCNSQQKIDDAFEILPNLVKGLDVNPKFRKFDDVEFTKECAIFDVLNIRLYHGWIVDPQDVDTAAAIGSKSYNILVSQVVAFQTRKTDREDNSNIHEGDYVDSFAATAVRVRDPSVRYSGGVSRGDFPDSAVVDQLGRGAGDRDEYLQTLRALTLSRADVSLPVISFALADSDCSSLSPSSESWDTIKDSTCPGSVLRSESSGDCKDSYDEVTPVKETIETLVVGTLSPEGSEPTYKREGSMVKAGHPGFKGRGPVSEGQLIKDFLENNASQLTIHGLFCLEKGLTENELSVFFRNNHFSTMYMFNGELYLLSTDEGYVDLSDLVWEKMNEVNGNSVFMTGSFTEFKAENQLNDSWNERSSRTSTTGYLVPFNDSTLNFEELTWIIDDCKDSSDEATLVKETTEISAVGHPGFEGQEVVCEGQLIQDFHDNCASQLTIHGLSCLQEGLKENEIMGRWGDLPEELLGTIAGKLDLVDYIHFGAVCRAWLGTTQSRLPTGKQVNPPNKNQIPWLMMAGEESDYAGENLTFINLIDQKVYSLSPFPELQGGWWLGSSNGWLITLRPNAEISLFNPPTRGTIKLPSATTFHDITGWSRNSQGVVTQYRATRINGTGSVRYPPLNFVFYLMGKVAMDPVSSTVVILRPSPRCDMSYARPGHHRWTAINSPQQEHRYSDVIFSDGLFCAVTDLAAVLIWDLDGLHPELNYHIVGERMPIIVNPLIRKYIVEAQGETFQVWREGRWDSFFSRSVTTGLSVFKLVKTWKPVDSLGQSSFFLGHTESFALSTADVPELIPNCVFFSDDYESPFFEGMHRRPRECRVCYLKDYTYGCYYPRSSVVPWPCPIWFVPTK